MLSSSASTVTTLPFGFGTTVSVSGMSWKVAVTVWLAPAGTKAQLVFVPRKAQGPPQPRKCDLTAGAAVRVISLASNSISEQSAPQLRPGPLTVPTPLPDLLTVTSVPGRNV